MKLAMSTLGCPEWDFIKVLGEYKRLGVKGIEIRGIDKEMAADKITWFSPEKAGETARLLKEHGLEFIGFGSSVRFHEADKYEQNIADGKATIDICARMGIPQIRVFGDKIPSEAEREAVIGRVISGLKELCAYAQGKNVRVLQEVHGDFNTIEALAPILEALKGYEAFGVIWDVQHSDKTYGDGYLKFYEFIKPYIRHVHIKDYKRDSDPKYRLCLTGEGDVPLESIIATLKKDGYDGWFSFEWEKLWQPQIEEPEVAFPHFVEFMKKQM